MTRSRDANSNDATTSYVSCLLAGYSGGWKLSQVFFQGLKKAKVCG